MTALSGKLRFSLNGRGYPLLYALLFGAAAVASLFFNGMRIEYFALSLFILFMLLYVILWRGYSRGLQIPKTPLVIALTLFWLWLAVTQLWSRVPYVSMVNFWWVGSACLVFWLMSLDPDRERVWPWTSAVVLAIGLALAAVSLSQLVAFDLDPRGTFLTRNTQAAFLGLVAVPATRYFLAARGGPLLSRPALWAWGLVLFVLVLAVAVTGSRGMALGLLAGFAVVVAVTRRDVPASRLIALCSIVVAAYVAANISIGSTISERLVSILNPARSGHERFLIWREAWRMLMDAPWLGIGLGTYWLYWPTYRHPDDTSGGFYVHNDYLQIWIETGLPGFLLLLAVYVAVFIMFVRLVRHPGTPPAARVEAAGLFGGLLVIAVHTFFDFDLYIHPIQLVMGLVLIRLHALYLAYVPADILVIQPAQRIGRRAYRIISFLVLLPPLMYFAALGGSAVLTYKARDLMTQARWVDASETLSRAAQLMPTSDLVLITHADLLRQAITQLPRDAPERTVLFREALVLLEDAEKQNPLRPQIFFIRGLLYSQSPDLAGGDWAARAARAYTTALKRDPLAFWAREAYAGLLMWQGKSAQAKQILEEGADYQYLGTAAVNYLVFLARARRQAGESERAAVLEKKISGMTGRPVGLSVQSPAPPARPKLSDK